MLAIVLFIAGCSGGGNVTPPPNLGGFSPGVTVGPLTTADEVSGGPCSVSVDGFLWYALPSGRMPPLDFQHVNCQARARIDAEVQPPIPAWSRPSGATKAIFVATSLQESYSLTGMQAIQQIASQAGLPITWMVGNAQYLTDDNAYYNALHASSGDDVELEDHENLYHDADQVLPWFGAAVSIEGAGHERKIARALALGNGGFWGITWNSHGTDGTSDEGTPWGTYCADVSSYKRPSPDGTCAFLGFEWTARDLTRAYLANTNPKGYSAEAAFSTDPDDLLNRGGFSPAGASTYVRSVVDAYAAAGVTQPLVMMSQQESIDEGTYGSTDNPVLEALYQEAVADGMKVMTLRQALSAAKQFSAQPRAVAFPFIPGGQETPYNGAPFTPATIDFHDTAAGMTFISGHTVPARVFEYAADPVSTYDHPLAATLPGSPAYPTLTKVVVSGQAMSFSFNAARAVHFGVALWSDPAVLGLSGANVFPAGHAGAVITFDLPPGRSTQTVTCRACTTTTLTYSQ